MSEVITTLLEINDTSLGYTIYRSFTRLTSMHMIRFKILNVYFLVCFFFNLYLYFKSTVDVNARGKQ